MPIKRDDLKTVQSILKIGVSGDIFIQGYFIDLFTALIGKDVPRQNNSLKFYIEKISLDLFSIETLFQKIMWEKMCLDDHVIGNAAWAQFAMIDVDYFHIELRSCFDHIASAINALPTSHSSPKSFNSLQKWCLKEEHSADIDERINFLVKSCSWFSDIKQRRDLIVHESGSSFVYFEKDCDWTLFQVPPDSKVQITIPEIMYDQKVIFELYMSLYFSYLLVFLDKLSAIICTSLGYEHKGSWAYHPGLNIYNKWLNELLSRDGLV